MGLTSDAIHPAALAFGPAGEVYERARPSYPSGVVTALGIAAGQRVVDLAAGTGKFTRLLVDAGADVVAIEPVEGMRAQLVVALPSVPAVAATAEHMPVATASCDAVTTAQAFPWFRQEEAVAEIARALKPGGRMATIYNVRDERQKWVDSMSAILDRYRGDVPKGVKKRGLEVVESSGHFVDHRVERFDNPQPSSPDGLADRVASISFIAALDDAERAKVLDEVRRLVEPMGPSFVVPHITEAHWWTRS
jgi:SAM-dependent methyltransferase